MEAFNISDLAGRNGASMVLLIRLFKAGQLSPGRAAKLAGMSLADFYECVSAKGVDVVSYEPAELDTELASFD
ncbi:MAG: UPF0175 family protein [Lautropia sp.]|nr:UPF0175 family protein [Lautropia sp.]